MLRFHRVQFRQTENSWRLDRPYRRGNCCNISCLVDAAALCAVVPARHARDNEIRLHSQPGIAAEIAVPQRPFQQKPARTSVQERTVSIPVCMYARRMVDNIEEPLSPEQIMKRSTKTFEGK